MVFSFPTQSTSSDMPQSPQTSYGPPVHPSSGYAAKAASMCPGRSISGMMVIPFAAAYSMISRIWSWEYHMPSPYGVWSYSLLSKMCPMMVFFLMEPTSVSLGYFLISTLQPWSSVRCQWRVLSLCISMMSRYLLTASIPKKCLDSSRCIPRYPNLGASSISQQGRVHSFSVAVDLA